jgi:electron transport complex protein RnfG
MLRVLLFIFTFSLAASPYAQTKTTRTESELHYVSNKAVVLSIYPNATGIEKVNEYWFKILDEKNKIKGYAMSSIPYCKEVLGYNNVTPVLIITDKNFIIKKVAMLSNYETLSYVKRLERNGFFNSWDELKLQDARKVKPDGYTGATLTAKAIAKNVEFLLENGVKSLPSKK